MRQKSHSILRTKSGERGFTLVEMLIVFSITAMLSTLLILYNRTGEYQIVLFREQSKIVSAIFRAKALSVATFGASEAPCGYGVHLDASGSYFLYRVFPPPGGNCSLANKQYVPGQSEQVESPFALPSTIDFGPLDVTDVFFVPPQPEVYLFPNPPQGTATVILKITGTMSSASVKITNAGQITAE